jgi:hypothetical protein
MEKVSREEDAEGEAESEEDKNDRDGEGFGIRLDEVGICDENLQKVACKSISACDAAARKIMCAWSNSLIKANTTARS